MVINYFLFSICISVSEWGLLIISLKKFLMLSPCLANALNSKPPSTTFWISKRLYQQILLAQFSALEKPCKSWEANQEEATYLTWMVQVLVDQAHLSPLCMLAHNSFPYCKDPPGHIYSCKPSFSLFNCSYGSTKCGLRQLNASLLKECRRSKVGIHTASPGMVLTDLLLRYAKVLSLSSIPRLPLAMITSFHLFILTNKVHVSLLKIWES